MSLMNFMTVQYKDIIRTNTLDTERSESFMYVFSFYRSDFLYFILWSIRTEGRNPVSNITLTWMPMVHRAHDHVGSITLETCKRDGSLIKTSGFPSKRNMKNDDTDSWCTPQLSNYGYYSMGVGHECQPIIASVCTLLSWLNMKFNMESI